MELTIYADLLFATNFLMDLLILFLTVQFSRIRFRLGRISLASALLALYGTVSFLPELELITSVLGRVAIGALAVRLLKPHGGWRGFLKACGAFALVSVGMGGVVYALATGTSLGRELQAVTVNGSVYFLLDMRLLLAGIALSYGLLFWYRSICIRNFSRDRVLVPMELQVGEKQIVLTVLVDTGCELKAPGTGEGVLLIAQSVLEGMTPQNSFWLPIHTAGGDDRLPAFYPDGVKVLNSRYELAEEPLLGIVKGKLSRDGLYSGICNPQILRESREDGGRNHGKEVERVFAAITANLAGVAAAAPKRGLLHRGERNLAYPAGTGRGGAAPLPAGRPRDAGASQKDPHRTESPVGGLHSPEV